MSGEDGKSNVKYLSPCGHHEAIYNDDTGVLDTSVKNMGTYNYGTSAIGHFCKDMLPYYLWGNAPEENVEINETKNSNGGM